MANRWFNQFYYTFHRKPVQLDCNFTVASTNGSGITGLIGGGIANVYMRTSVSVAQGNPNPVTGLILVKFNDNYSQFYLNSYSIASPLTGTSISISGSTVMTIGAAYTITALGTTTTAQWVVVGVPVGTTPAVGVTFLAAITGAGTGTGTVQASTTSGNTVIEVVGDPNMTISSRSPTTTPAITGKPGPYLILQTISLGTAAFTGTTNTSTSVTAVSSFVGLRVGQLISGTGIPLGTTIAALTPGSSTLTLSAAATASATVPMEAAPAPLVQSPVDGSKIYMSFLLSSTSTLVQGN